MRRWVSRALRAGLFAFAVALIIWLPFSFYWSAIVRLPPPAKGFGASCNIGEVRLFAFRSEYRHQATPIARLHAQGLLPFRHRGLFWIRVENIPGERLMLVSLPGWLVAFICLAWPVTSFFTARRRNKRGFPVVSSTTLQGPQNLSIICGVETGSTGRTHSCRVHGGRTAELLAIALRARGVAVRVTRAGGEKRILQFPDSNSVAEAGLDRFRYQELVIDATAALQSEAKADGAVPTADP